MIKFLNKKNLLTFHENQLKTYGGISGIRDEGLLDSALEQPEASFGGVYMHSDIFHMAAAYGYHICQNHPFLDGNKGTALIAMYMFLFVNGYQIALDKKSLYALVMGVANGEIDKDQLADFLRKGTKPR
ncbi:MAG: toxin-antitoxin system Doc family toxin component [Bacteroidetes bacterium HLUCCA01]|nr:MAG: toxin-antitoxin system Doc family toxin component [Bacteroidetes bacterium HLUCCA01]